MAAKMVVKSEVEPNDIIKRAKNDYSWKILELLGSGGYGKVFKVIQVKEDGTLIAHAKEYAMKTEMKSTNKNTSRLKIEKNVMEAYAKSETLLKEHFPEMVDLGQTSCFKWIVMTLVGPSLEALKRNGFTISTALQCGLQTLKAIRDFHQMGFLHRDLKPANFCVGIHANIELIYMLDFGLTRMYRKKDGTIRPPRQRTKMIGTPRFCSRASHRKMELSRKDDFESWYFMLLDFVDHEKGIPWRGKSREQAYQLKQQVFDQPTWISTISPLIPSSFGTCAEYMNELEYESDVEWSVFRDVITEYARKAKITLKERLDWIPATGSSRVPIVPGPAIKTLAVQDKESLNNNNSKLGQIDNNSISSGDDETLDVGNGNGKGKRSGSKSKQRSKRGTVTVTTTTTVEMK
ncbi:unnamed protein product [Caenorhabditis angaria]|uniref:non-specific serine/threonine protein kinase n=1 Tax=Caenorhabditis angaria TaxID=860376 RepID=A0A9P1MSC9_9PELO|nr:unnamed protein product [Caenorhabditis angaria]